MSLLTDFSELFAGREDCYGGEGGFCVKRRLTLPVWRSHLFGTNPIGVYPLMAATEVWDDCTGLPDDMAVTGWSAIDVDFDDMDFAFTARDMLADVGIHSYVESSRSKGWHVWMFWDDWCDAKASRALLLWLVSDLGHPKMEVYPKQFDTSGTGLGNYLRLPYPARWTKTQRQIMYDENQEPMTLKHFMRVVQPNDHRHCESIARRSPYWPGNIKIDYPKGTPGEAHAHGVFKTQDAWRYIEDPEAVIVEGERDNTLHAIARLMAGLHWDLERQRDMMTRIVHTQVQGHFPLRSALEKVERANRERERHDNRYVS